MARSSLFRRLRVSDPSTITQSVQKLLDRLRVGDETARDELLALPVERFRRMAHAVLRTSPRVHRWEETDDLLQGASLRLWQALQSNCPTTPAEFYGLAGVCARRELIDMSRKLFGPEGLGANHASRVSGTGDSRPDRHPSPVDSAPDPVDLAVWTEFHQRVEELLPEDRLLFDLLWYQGLSQPEAAMIAGVPERSLRRRWRSARMKLDTVLRGDETPSAER